MANRVQARRRHAAVSRRRMLGPLCALLGIGLLLGCLPFISNLDRRTSVDLLLKLRGEREAPDNIEIVGASLSGVRLIQERCETAQSGLCVKPEFQSCMELSQRFGSQLPRCYYRYLLDRVLQYQPALVAVDVAFSAHQSRDDPQRTETTAIAAMLATAGNVVVSERWRIERRAGVEMHRRERIDPLIERAALATVPFPIPKATGMVRDFWLFKDTMADAPTLPTVMAGAALAHRIDAFQAQLLTWSRQPPDSLRTAGVDAPLPMAKETLQSASLLPDASQAPSQSLSQSMKDKAIIAGLRALLHQAQAGMLPDGLRELAQTNAGLSRMIALMQEGREGSILNFYGTAGSISTVEASDLLVPRDEAKLASLTGKYVFVGFSSIYDPQHADSHTTVFSRADGVDLSGVEIAATATANLLTGTELTWVDLPIRTLTGLLLGALAITLLYFLSGLYGLAAILVVGSAYLGASITLLSRDYVAMPLVVPLGIILPSIALSALLLQFLLEKRQRSSLSQSLQRFVPNLFQGDFAGPDFLHKAQTNIRGVLMAVDGENYTNFSEQMTTDELRDYMNWFFSEILAIVEKYDGTVTDIKADSLMCIWPDRSDGPRYEDAGKAAVEILKAVTASGAPKAPRILMPRLGLHHGDVGFGSIGGKSRLEFSLYGDAANTVSRIEALNKDFGTRILASGDMGLRMTSVASRYCGRYLLRGKADPTPIWHILGPNGQLNEIRLRELESYRSIEHPLLEGNLEALREALTTYRALFPDDKVALAIEQKLQDGEIV
jgi:adenylate cyclase